MYPQQVNPSLAALTDPRFRKALLHALDREGISETIMAGLAPVAHTNVPPALSEFDQIQNSIVRYEYDARKTGQLLEGMGYRRGSGGFWEDASGQRLTFEHRTSATGAGEVTRATVAATDYWRQAGLDAELLMFPRLDASVAAQYPGILTKATGGDVSALYRYFHSSFAPSAENRFTGANSARYTIPEHDALLDRWFTAVPRAERTQALAELVRYQTDNAIWMGYFYNPQVSWVSNRLRDVTPSSYVTKGFNAHLWDPV
jgi:peptide/nickel transport system substrate-binding protein